MGTPTSGADARPGKVLLVRHGETTWSASGQHTSRTDLPLTARGESAATGLRPLLDTFLAGRPPGLVLSSPLRRAWHTAELAGLAPERDPDLREVDYGDYEGRTTPEIRRTVPGWTVWTHPSPGGETLADAGRRVDRVLDRARAVLVPGGGDVVLVAHGHVLRVLVARWLGLDPAAGRLFALGTATLGVLDTEHETAVVRHWNLPNPALA